MTSEKFLPAKILDVVPSPMISSCFMWTRAARFSYLAGQYATLGVEVEGERIERAYSLCSSPYENVLEFFVERIPNGELTPLLYAMDKGAPLFLRRFAKGRFTLDSSAAARIISSWLPSPVSRPTSATFAPFARIGRRRHSHAR